jgi:hypothetical protein
MIGAPLSPISAGGAEFAAERGGSVAAAPAIRGAEATGDTRGTERRVESRGMTGAGTGGACPKIVVELGPGEAIAVVDPVRRSGAPEKDGRSGASTPADATGAIVEDRASVALW